MSSANVIQVVYDTPYPLPVSAAALPLPFGAATAANQSAQTAILTNIDANTPVLVGGRVPVDGSGVTQPISAVALPLPTVRSLLQFKSPWEVVINPPKKINQ